MNLCRRVAFLCLVAIGTWLGAVAHAAAPSTLALSIRTWTTEIGICEPVIVILHLTNHSSAPAHSDPNDFMLVQFFTSRDGGPYVFSGFSKNAELRVSGVRPDIPPSGSKSQEELLFLINVGSGRSKQSSSEKCAFAFAQAGKYRLKAKRHEAESNVLEILVREPTKEESAAAERFTKGDVACFLQGAGLMPKEEAKAAAELEELLSADHAAQFNDWARRRLGDYCLDEWRKDHNDAVRERGFKHFAAVSPRVTDLRLYAACQQLTMLGAKPAWASGKEFLRLDKFVFAPESEKCTSVAPLLLQSARVAALCLRIAYVDDARLDTKVDWRFGRLAADEEILRRVSEQANVTLSIHERAGRTNVVGRAQKVGTLRECLRALSNQHLGYWTPIGDGYMRVPVTDVVPIPKK